MHYHIASVFVYYTAFIHSACKSKYSHWTLWNHYYQSYSQHGLKTYVEVLSHISWYINMEFKEPHESRYILPWYHNMPQYHELPNKCFILVYNALNNIDKRLWNRLSKPIPSKTKQDFPSLWQTHYLRSENIIWVYHDWQFCQILLI